MRRVDFSNGGGDLIGGLKSKGVGCIPPGQGRKEQVREKQYLPTQRSESVESPYNTWGSLLQLQEIKQIFSQASWVGGVGVS